MAVASRGENKVTVSTLKKLGPAEPVPGDGGVSDAPGARDPRSAQVYTGPAKAKFGGN